MRDQGKRNDKGRLFAPPVRELRLAVYPSQFPVCAYEIDPKKKPEDQEPEGVIYEGFLTSMNGQMVTSLRVGEVMCVGSDDGSSPALILGRVDDIKTHQNGWIVTVGDMVYKVIGRAFH